jgi:hypothetical protein
VPDVSAAIVVVGGRHFTGSADDEQHTEGESDTQIALHGDSPGKRCGSAEVWVSGGTETTAALPDSATSLSTGDNFTLVPALTVGDVATINLYLRPT